MMAKFTKYGLPVAAVGLFLVAVMHVVTSGQETAPTSQPLAQPPTAPFEHSVAGSGLVEAETEDIAVGSPVPGIVADVPVEESQTPEDVVPKGAELFRLDDRELQAQRLVKQAALDAARADLARLENLPRPEQVPVSEAAVALAEANVAKAERDLARAQRLFDRKAATQEDLENARTSLAVAQAEEARARAELTLLKAGSWEPELAVARAQVARAVAEVEQIDTELSRLVVRAPKDGQILQVNVRPGEFVGTPPNQALIVMGNTQRLHVRVDIDEADIPRFRPDAPAVGMLKGHPGIRYPLRFRKVEPYVIPKRSLTGENTERIDTRVLQVIYEVEGTGPRLYVGQQMDIFIEAAPHSNHDRALPSRSTASR